MMVDHQDLEYVLLQHRWIKSVDPFAHLGLGWLAIMRDVLKEADAVMAQHPGVESRGFYCKEKFGGLRIHPGLDGAPPELWQQLGPLLDRAEARSFETCEVCGKAGSVRQRQGWYRTRCDAHDTP